MFGQAGETFELSVNASVADGGTLSYQWYSNTTASNEGGTLITGATGASYLAPKDVIGTFYYYVVVTNTNNAVNGEKVAIALSNCATIDIASYIVNIGSQTNGSISVDKLAANEATTVTITITPSLGYEVTSVTVGALTVTKVNDTTYTFVMPASDVTVNATFVAIPYNVTLGTQTNGSFTSDKQTAIIGETVTITVTPNEGYEASSVVAGELTVTKVNATTYTFVMYANNVTIDVEFETVRYAVRINIVSSGGTIIRDKNTATFGETVTITISPQNNDYRLVSGSLTITGDLVLTKVDEVTYTFVMPSNEVTISAAFEPMPYYSLSYDNNSGYGYVYVPYNSVGGGQLVYVKPQVQSSGYRVIAGTVKLLLEGGGEILLEKPDEDGKYWFNMPESNAIATCEFEPLPTFNISIDSLTNGYISAKSTAYVGETVWLTVEPHLGYKLDVSTLGYKISGSGELILIKDILFRFTMPENDITTYAEFIELEANEHTVSIQTSYLECIYVNNRVVATGDTVIVTILPREGYRLVAGSLYYKTSDDSETQNLIVWQGDNYSFTMPDSNVIIYAEFEELSYYNIYCDYSEGGNAYPDYINVQEGREAIVYYYINSTYAIESIVIREYGKEYATPIEYTINEGYIRFIMPGYDVQVNVTFGAAQEYTIDVPNMGISYNDVLIENGRIGLLIDNEGNLRTFYEGQFFEIRIEADYGYRVKSVRLSDGTVATKDQNYYSFIMPGQNVTLLIEIESVTYYDIVLDNDLTNILAISITSYRGLEAYDGELVLIYPASVLVELIEVMVDGVSIDYSAHDNYFWFIMPNHAVTITATVYEIPYTSYAFEYGWSETLEAMMGNIEFDKNALTLEFISGDVGDMELGVINLTKQNETTYTGEMVIPGYATFGLIIEITGAGTLSLTISDGDYSDTVYYTYSDELGYYVEDSMEITYTVKISINLIDGTDSVTIMEFYVNNSGSGSENNKFSGSYVIEDNIINIYEQGTDLFMTGSIDGGVITIDFTQDPNQYVPERIGLSYWVNDGHKYINEIAGDVLEFNLVSE